MEIAAKQEPAGLAFMNEPGHRIGASPKLSHFATLNLC
jgi:hypothetical protein